MKLTSKMATKTVIVDVTFEEFDPGDKVKPSSPRSALPPGVYTVTEFVPPLIPYELDGIVFVDGHDTGYSAEYIMLAENRDGDNDDPQ